MKFKTLIYEKYHTNFNALSVKSGVPVTTLRNINERDSFFNTKISIILKIAYALGVSVDDMIYEMKKD
jgi:hypothetical protein